jgi:hypothetical protein
MTQLEKRIQRLESVYLPDQSRVSTLMCWPEFQFFYEFPKVFPDPNKAPPIALMTYRKLKKRWDRNRAKIDAKQADQTFPKTDRKEEI